VYDDDCNALNECAAPFIEFFAVPSAESTQESSDNEEQLNFFQRQAINFFGEATNNLACEAESLDSFPSFEEDPFQADYDLSSEVDIQPLGLRRQNAIISEPRAEVEQPVVDVNGRLVFQMKEVFAGINQQN
jgi:hypothetical protein